MNLHILQEGHGHAPAPQVPFQGTEHQERQPGHQQEGGDPLAHERQRIVGQVRPAQKLEERAAQDQREVRRSPERTQVFGGLWRIHCVRSDLMWFKVR